MLSAVRAENSFGAEARGRLYKNSADSESSFILILRRCSFCMRRLLAVSRFKLLLLSTSAFKVAMIFLNRDGNPFGIAIGVSF